MAEDVLLEVDLAYSAELSERGKRKRFEASLGTRGSVLVRHVSGADAPKVVEVSWPDGGPPPAMHWRSFDGSLWRPLVGPGGAALDGAGDFEETLGRQRRETMRGVWADYPFKIVSGDPRRDGLNPFGLPDDIGDHRVHASGLEEAARKAQAMAQDDMLVVDGVMLMRSPPPVWAVGRTHTGPWSSPGLVRLAMADHPYHDDRLVSFPLDRREDAVAFARFHAEQVGRQEFYRRRHPIQPPLHVVMEARVRHGDVAFPDTRLDDLRRVMEVNGRTFAGVGADKVGLGMREALESLARLVSEDGKGGAGWVDEADAAIAEAVAGAAPGWPVEWPNGSSAVERLRGLQLRHAFETGLVLQDDVDALAYLAP